MKMRFSLILTFFLIIGCGKQPIDHTPVVNIGPEFSSIVQSFQNEAQSQGSPVFINDLIIQMVPHLGRAIMGVCLTDPALNSITPTIQISKEMWDVLDLNDKEELVYHELGHCVLFRDHRKDINNQIPISLMSPAFLGSTLYLANKDQYLHELFTKENLTNSFPMVIPMNTFIPMQTETGQ